jgi:hypothetical protein
VAEVPVGAAGEAAGTRTASAAARAGRRGFVNLGLGADVGNVVLKTLEYLPILGAKDEGEAGFGVLVMMALRKIPTPATVAATVAVVWSETQIKMSETEEGLHALEQVQYDF